MDAVRIEPGIGDLVEKEVELGDLLVSYLEQLGVEYVFGIPGGAIEPLYNALARSERRGGPRAIVARHETGAAFMAEGYAIKTGKLGVCCATTGPGATNMITGVASAYENNVPLLVITAQTALANFGKISGPLLDRIDIHIEVTPVPFEKLTEERKGESSVEIRKRVTAAREIQSERFTELENVHYNAQMNVKQIRKYCKLSSESMSLLKTAMEKLNLSARAYDRILKVARTIGDLDASKNISPTHIAEAIQYRSLDRDGWLGG